MSTLIVQFGPCGFGRFDGFLPGYRLGLVQVSWVKGTLEARFQRWADALKAAAASVSAGL